MEDDELRGETRKTLAWRNRLGEREQREVEFAGLYVEDFNHGTAGHLSYSVIRQLTELLDAYEWRINKEIREVVAGSYRLADGRTLIVYGGQVKILET